MAWFRRKSEADLAREAAEKAVARRRERFHLEPTGPEATASAARAAQAQGDLTEALRLAVRSVDRLHDLYCFDQFALRRPSAADSPVIDFALDTLETVRTQRPGTDVKLQVEELTHRLRSMSIRSEENRMDAILYRAALDRLAAIAPDVAVDAIHWY